MDLVVVFYQMDSIASNYRGLLIHAARLTFEQNNQNMELSAPTIEELLEIMKAEFIADNNKTNGCFINAMHLSIYSNPACHLDVEYQSRRFTLSIPTKLSISKQIELNVKPECHFI